MKPLAIHGGDPSITISKPHYIWPILSEKTNEAILKQLKESISIYDKSGIIKTFETKFSQYHNRSYSLLCNSGTSALHSMYKAIDLSVDDEILCPIYTFFATVTPILFTGATPVFIDCLPNGNIDPYKIENKINEKTKALVVTHMWGIPCEMDYIVKICEKYNLILLEDCSHSHGARYKGKLTGTFGKAAIWSLQGQKIITGGEGGILLTDDENIYYKAQLLGHYNKRCINEIPTEHNLYKFSTTGYGLKFRSHPLAVAIANEQFDNLDTWLFNKRRFAKKIIDALSSCKFLKFPNFDDMEPSWYALIIKYDESLANNIPFTDYINALFAEGLVEIDVPKSTAPLNIYPLFNEPHSLFPEFYPRNLSFIDTNIYSEAEKFYNFTFKLPVWATEEDEQ
ncbi:MAG: cell wall biogenesis protein, partial [Flavobacteriaceae bacterium]